MIKVYHNPDFMEFVMNETVDLKKLVAVAAVNTQDFEEAFKLTNHIHHDWTTNPRVIAIGDFHRSTSVGDVMEQDNEKFVVLPIGFVKLNEEGKILRTV